jgi:Putative viral replication protein.
MKPIITDLSKKCRKMLLTINNPDKNETTPKGWLINTNAINCALNNDNEAKAWIINHIREYIDNSDIVKGKTNTYYCFSLEVGKEGTPHLHIFFNFDNARYGNKIKKTFPTAHIDYCNGSNNSVKDYVFKTGKLEGSEKEDTKVVGTQFENGELPEEKGQGKRTDLEFIKELIEQGKTPKEILNVDPNFYPLEAYINKMFYNKRLEETPFQRPVKTVVHTGATGSGKTFFATKLVREETYVGTDYSNGCTALLDGYTAQKNLFLDEFRGQIPYNMLLTMLNGYTHDVHARYNNKYMLWDTVHITSVIPMEQWYNNDNIRDTYEQLQRRVSEVVFHFMSYHGTYIPDKIQFLRDYGQEVEKDIEYHEYAIEGYKYTKYEDLEKEALEYFNIKPAREVTLLNLYKNLDRQQEEIKQHNRAKNARWEQTNLLDLLNDDSLPWAN